MKTLPLKDAQNLASQEHAVRLREAWVRDVIDLSQQVEMWAAQSGWIVTQSDMSVSEETIGSYSVPKLEMDVPASFVSAGTHWEAMAGRLILEPVASHTITAQGRVDLYAWPSFFRVMLLRYMEPSGAITWIVRTESGLDWPLPWSEHTFLGIAIGLLRA